MKIVGLLGLRGSGKDTAAAALVSQLGFTRLAFADPLYNEVAEAFGVTVAFLQNRDTKELPQPELALVNCKDARFVKVCIELDIAEAGMDGVKQRLHALYRPRSPRQILQRWGTDYRRVLDGDDYWRAQVEKIIDNAPQSSAFVITDVRFPDEALLVTCLGGWLARITRPTAQTQDVALLHVSEQAMLDYPVHKTFLNVEGRFAEMQSEVLETVRLLLNTQELRAAA